MKIKNLLLWLTLLATCPANAQLGQIIKDGINFFSKSASKKVLSKEVERLSANSVKPKTEQEAFNFISSNSVIISDKNALRLSQLDVFEYSNGIYNHGIEELSLGYHT